MESNIILENIKYIDRETCKEQDIINLIKEYGNLSGVLITYYPRQNNTPPNLFTRTTIYDPLKEDINSVSRLSYPPIEINYKYGGYQRASTPCRAMFYATKLNSISETDSYSAISTAFIESLKKDYDELLTSNKQVVFSLWQLIKPIRLLSVFNSSDYNNKNPHTAEISDSFNNWLITQEEKSANKIIALMDFLNSIYSKPIDIIENKNEYKLSSVITQYMIDNIILNDEKIDGVVFPSTKVEGKELNVAIKPDSVDLKLGCIKVLDCSVLPDFKLKVEREESIQPLQNQFKFLKADGRMIELHQVNQK